MQESQSQEAHEEYQLKKISRKMLLVPSIIPLQRLPRSNKARSGTIVVEAWSRSSDVSPAEPLTASCTVVALGVAPRFRFQPVGHRLKEKKHKLKHGGRHRLYKKRAIYDVAIGITDPLPGY